MTDCLGLPLSSVPSCFPKIIVVTHVLFRKRCPTNSFFSSRLSPILIYFHLSSKISFIFTHSVQEILNSLRQHHVSKSSIFLPSAFIIVHDSAPYSVPPYTIHVPYKYFYKYFLMFIFIAFVVKNICFAVLLYI